ncbi:MAG: LPPG:FO 2-phospho-L-lactate transferase [Actinomycetes bacterium]|jgi:LPPG:FO 2-phospho-L-lactate transferase
MQVAVLAGGIGAARFLKGLVNVTQSEKGDRPTGNSDLPTTDITVIGNTGDDIRMFGLQICPDLDSVMYTLGGGADEQRGWGRANETFTVLEELRAHGAQPDWFNLGDRDFATHIIRTQMLEAGYALSTVTLALATRWKLPLQLIPMSDDRVETHIIVADPQTGEETAIHFQEWWVKHRAALRAQEFVYVGQDEAQPAPGVIEVIRDADLVILPPSNPVVSLGPILGMAGIRRALAETAAPIVGISPIVAGAPVRGMADACLSAIGVPTTASGVAQHYGARRSGGILDGWIVDNADSAEVHELTALGIEAVATDTIFSNPGAGDSVAQLVLDLGRRLARGARDSANNQRDRQ